MDEERIKALEARVAALEEQAVKPVTVTVRDDKALTKMVESILKDPRRR